MVRRMIVALVCLLGISAGALMAADMTVEYSFPQPTVEKITIEGVEYDRVTMSGLSSGGDPGQPRLPAGSAQILLPLGAEMTDIRIDAGEQIVIGSGFLLEPVGEQFRLSSDPADLQVPYPDQLIYRQDTPFPETLFENIGTYAFRGYQILTLKLHPIQVTPATGELVYYSDFTISVTVATGGQISPMARGLAEDDDLIRRRVDNPETATTYLAGLTSPPKSYDLLIICDPSTVSQFQVLKDYHDSTGIPTEIHTTDETGVAPKDVRNFITDEYTNNGIGYVLIGADDDFIPAPDLYVRTSAGGDIETAMPGDLYFGCLDGGYDGDGDGIWGESNDGPGGGDIDLVHEVFVGRASIGNGDEATRFVSKTISYLTTGEAYLQNMQLVGEHLGFGGVSEYAAATLDQLVDGSSADGYSTIGIPSTEFEIGRLYDRDWPGNDWPRSALTDLINDGLHVIDHLGHGSPGYAMKYTSAQLMSYMQNDNFFFVYSQTCLAGHFDGTDCWAEYATIKSDHAAFAVVMNARYGFGAYNSTDGTSQRFNREFWDAVYNPAEAKPQLGMANADAKEDNLYRINEPCMRWIYYESNLFGDPTVQLHGGGIWFTMDTPYGWVPHTVSFQGESSRDVDSWTWDFGDGDSAFVQNPTHVFDERGMYDVTLMISCDGDQLTRQNCDCIAALADSIYADTVVAVAGETVEVVINATNTVPVSEIIIPVQYGGTLGFDQLDVTWSTEGCRTAGLDEQQQIHFNPNGYEMSYRLANQGGSEDLAPGQGPILRLFFQLDGPPAFGEETVIDISGYNTYEPTFENSIFDYDPIVINGMVHNPDCCQGFRGNIDGDSEDVIQITDLIYLVQYMFQDGPEPPCMKEANVNGDIFGEIDIDDLIMLVNYMFQDGPEPAICY